MKIEVIEKNEQIAAVVSDDKKVIVDTRSALDLAMTVRYETGAANIVIDKNLVCDDFFILSTGIAGEILQKYMNYHVRIAFYGDFSHYTSKPLKDFIYESNKGKYFFFAENREEAVNKLMQIQ